MEMRIVDLSDDWKGKSNMYCSFDEVAYELGLDSPKLKMSGADVYDKYWSDQLDDIKDYCESDIRTSIEIEKVIYKN